MSEKPKNIEAPRYRVDPWPFAAAFIGGPILVTVATFWIYYVPLIALIYGGPFYILFGLPLGIIHLRRTPGDTGGIVRLALTVIGAAAIPIFLLAALFGGPGGATAAGILSLLALIFAAAWSAMAGAIYSRLRSDDSRHPINEVPLNVFD